MGKILLASQSTGRAEILRQLKLDFNIFATNIKEITVQGRVSLEEVEKITSKNSSGKLSSILNDTDKLFDNKNRHYDLVIAADTVCFLEGRIIGKPKTKSEAREILMFLSGKEHKCITSCSLAYWDEKYEKVFHSNIIDCSIVKLTSNVSLMNFYLNHGNQEYLHKAGAYAIQGLGGSLLVEYIKGSQFNVTGLPIQKIFNRLIEEAPYVFQKILNN